MAEKETVSPEQNAPQSAERTPPGQAPPGGPPTEFFSIPLSSLRMDTVTGFNLYLRNAMKKYVLYRGAELKFTEAHKAKLVESKVRKIYIASRDRCIYLRYMEDNLDNVISDSTMPIGQKTEIIYESSTNLVEDVFGNPNDDDNIQRIHRLSNSTVHHMLEGPSTLGPMLTTMSFDYGLYTHCLNVCLFGVALAQRLGFGTREMKELGTGLLMHDIGKTRVPNEILKKPGPLTAEEWRIIKTHPQLGLEMMHQSGNLTPGSEAVILQHHEKCTGRGYPKGLKEPAIHIYAKIAALADVFDALTTQRPYAAGVKSFPAIRTMQEEMQQDFNRELFREMILMLNLSGAPTANQDPDGRAPADSAA